MNKERLISFLRELDDLEEKHGIYVGAGYGSPFEYEYYDGGEEVYITEKRPPHLTFSDKYGNEMTLDNLDIDDLTELRYGKARY